MFTPSIKAHALKLGVTIPNMEAIVAGAGDAVDKFNVTFKESSIAVPMALCADAHNRALFRVAVDDMLVIKCRLRREHRELLLARVDVIVEHLLSLDLEE